MWTIVKESRVRGYSRTGTHLAALAVGGLLSITASATIACGGEVPTSCDDEVDDASDRGVDASTLVGVGVFTSARR